MHLQVAILPKTTNIANSVISLANAIVGITVPVSYWFDVHDRATDGASLLAPHANDALSVRCLPCLSDSIYPDTSFTAWIVFFIPSLRAESFLTSESKRRTSPISFCTTSKQGSMTLKRTRYPRNLMWRLPLFQRSRLFGRDDAYDPVAAFTMNSVDATRRRGCRRMEKMCVALLGIRSGSVEMMASGARSLPGPPSNRTGIDDRALGFTYQIIEFRDHAITNISTENHCDSLFFLFESAFRNNH